MYICLCSTAAVSKIYVSGKMLMKLLEINHWMYSALSIYSASLFPHFVTLQPQNCITVIFSSILHIIPNYDNVNFFFLDFYKFIKSGKLGHNGEQMVGAWGLALKDPEWSK